MTSHQTLRRLTYFAAIAEAGSIRGAAKKLNLSVPVLSEALSELEAELGVSLATRTTRRFALTVAGARAQTAAQNILETAHRLSDLTSDDQPLTGKLGITIPVELAGFWLPEKLKRFVRAHPCVVFDVDVTDAVLDIRSSPIEVAIRTEYVPPAGTCSPPDALDLVVVANSAVGVDPSEAIDLPLIDSQFDRRLLATASDGRVLPVSFQETFRVTNRAAALALARQGVGAVMVMRGSVSQELAEGALFEVLPDLDFGSIKLNALFRDRMPGRAVEAFVKSVGL